MAEPFLKWVGGKRQLLPELHKRLVLKPNATYWEPFVGGGALFFDIADNLQHAVLGDANKRLILAYRGVRDRVDQVVNLLSKMPVSAQNYAAVRDLYNTGEAEPQLEAARLIYLNRTCFNGVYRLNRAGKFNVPWGSPPLSRDIVRADHLRTCSRALQGVRLLAGDFTDIAPEPGDTVYFDPPYVPTSASADFTDYTAGGFGGKDQVQLRDFALQLARNGVHVLLSNSWAARKLYPKDQFDVARVYARRGVNRDATKRGAVREVLVTPRHQRRRDTAPAGRARPRASRRPTGP